MQKRASGVVRGMSAAWLGGSAARRAGWAAVLLLATTTLTACENPATPGRHLHAYGVVIYQDDTQVVRAQGQAVTGELTVVAGHVRSPLTVRMLDRNGEEITLPSGYWLRVDSPTPAIARWTQMVEGEFRGGLMGIIPGEAQLEFCLMHGAVGRGHEDGCQALTVRVLAG